MSARRSGAAAARPDVPFVGRHAEAALLGLTLERNDEGPAAVILRGEPGIGKTRLLSEVIGRAVAGGRRVIWVRATPLESRVPFGAVSVALDRAASTHQVVAPAAHVLRDFVAGGSSADPRMSFARVCDSFTRMLVELADGASATVVVDDLHLLDHESLSLLAVALGRVEGADVSFVCSTRSSGRDFDAHGSDLLARIGEWADVEELPIGPLSDDEVHEVLGAVLGREVPRELAELVQRRSGGNPLFVLEMARSISELDLLPDDLPTLVRSMSTELHLTRHTAVLQRLFPLSPDCRRVAQIVAVLDRVRVDELALVSDVTQISESEVSAAFDELERHGILTMDVSDAYSLFHPFAADALYDDIGPAERRRVHKLVAQHLGARRGRGEHIDLNRLAWHAGESAVVGDVAAAAILRDAAESIKTTGPVSAAALCQRALELLPEPSPLRTELLSLRVRCLTLAALSQEAVDAGLLALAEMEAGEERARVADGVISGLLDAGRVAEARQLADHEVAAGRPSTFLRAQQAMLLALDGDADLARTALDRVLAAPVPSSGEEVLVEAFVGSTYATLGLVADAVHHFDVLRDVAYLARPSMKVYGLTRRAWCLVILGCVSAAVEAIGESEAVIGDIGPGVHATGVQASKIALDWMRGDWDAALAAGIAARRSSAMSTIVRRYLQSMEIEIRAARGELREALALVNQPVPGASVTMAAWATAGALLAAGDTTGARTVLRGAVDRPLDRAWLPQVLARLVELEHGCGEESNAATALEQLERHLADNRDDRAWVRSIALRTRALVSGDSAAAREASAVAADDGLTYDVALARLVVGATDTAEVDMLLSAHETFGALGAESDRRRAASLLRERGAKVPRRKRSTPGQLTRAEAQIARLVQSGMRNREIAQTANYSERTVEVYLSRIYAKLGVASRLQLARFLDEHGLPDDADATG